MSKENGGPAYPVAFTTTPLQGMSLRDYFAAQAIQGMLANDEVLVRFIRASAENMIDPDVMAATAAYGIADAMLKERDK